MASELDFCRHLLTKFEAFWINNKAPYLGPFRRPVDEVRDNAPDYYTTVKSAMDLSLMDVKLNNGLYSDARAFKADFDLMMANCRLYNAGNGAFVRRFADRFERDFEWEFSEMRKWMTAERRKLRAITTAATTATATNTAPNAPTTAAITAPASAPTTAPNAVSAPAAAPAPSVSSSGSERYVI
jgi:transcription initiation factor TFIID subunit 2